MSREEFDELLFGLFAQDIYEAIPNKLRFSGALRFNVASYLSRATNSPLVGGKPLWPDDNLRAHDFSGRVGFVVTPAKPVSIAFNYSRGFRAPNITIPTVSRLVGRVICEEIRKLPKA